MDLDPGRILELAAHWPDLTCMVVGGFVGFVLVLVIERFFLPTAVDPVIVRRQRGITFMLCVAISTVASTALWSVWDPADPFTVRYVSSLSASVLTTFLYPIVAKLATAKWPAIGSAWDGGGK